MTASMIPSPAAGGSPSDVHDIRALTAAGPAPAPKSPAQQGRDRG